MALPIVEGMRRIVVVLATLVFLSLAAPARGDVGLPRGRLPVAGPVVTPYDPPEVRWGSGHRGVDIAAEPGATVVAAASGRISFSGMVAGRGVLVIDHGTVRTTYEPVTATVAVGTQVAAGDPVARLEAGHPCPAPACLHWGLRSGEEYLDPMLLIGPSQVRLLPRGVTPRPVTAAPVAGSGSSRPADGPITSPFGMRRHPVTGVWKLHDGADIGAACGTPIRAWADGVVVSAGWDGAYGNRVLVDHGTGSRGHVVTGYAHAQSFAVRAGARVARGQVIAAVGTTGMSTGCHLHAQAWVNQQLIDPTGLW